MGPIRSHHNKNSRRPVQGTLRLAIFLCALPWTVLTATAANTQPAVPSLEDARWFQVELILFAQQRGEPLEAEQWPKIEGLTLPDSLLELHLPPQKTMTSEADVSPESTLSDDSKPPTDASPGFSVTDADGLPHAYQILDDDALQLTEIAAKLRRSSRFKPLLHIAWQQPTYDRQHAQPIFFMQGMDEPLAVGTGDEALTDNAQPLEETQPVSTLPSEPLQALAPEYATEADAAIGPPNPQFVGTVTLSVERYLHFATDLMYRRPVTQREAIPISDLDLWYDRPYPTLSEPQGPAYRLDNWQAMRGFRLAESRRMRSREIHYLDSPFMGVVVVITPVELPEPAEEIQQTSPQNILLAPKKR